jgi:GNAT superfamily N-acetyltransferase
VLQRLRGYFHTAVADLRYQGVEVFLWRSFVKVVSPLVTIDLHILYDKDLTVPIEQRQAKVECSIGQASPADLDEIIEMQVPLPPPDVVDRLSDEQELQYAQLAQAQAKAKETFLHTMRAGELCFVARVDGIVAHSNWTRFHDCAPVEGRPVHLLPGEIYTTDGFTDERWRGMRVHEAVLTHMLRFAQGRGCHLAYTITDLTKAGSRRGLRRVGGWRRRGRILYITPRGLGRTWLVRFGGDVEPMFRHARESMERR